jgi:hypothetical protein
MNWDLVTGLLYLILLGVIPAVGLLMVWRNTPPRSSAFVWALAAVPVFAFVFGGSWFAVQSWIARGGIDPPRAIPIWGVFVMCGAFSVMFCLPMVFGGGLLLLLWQRIHPATYARFTARPIDSIPDLETERSDANSPGS